MNLRKTPFPIILIAFGFLCFGIVLIESLIVNAQSFSDLSFIGKTFTVIFTLILGFAFVKYMVLPVCRWIVNLVKL